MFKRTSVLVLAGMLLLSATACTTVSNKNEEAVTTTTAGDTLFTTDDTAVPTTASETGTTVKQTTTQKSTTTTKASTTTKATTTATQSSGSQYEKIYNEYAQKIRDAAPTSGMTELAELANEGVQKMASYMLTATGTDGQYATYQEWADKLYQVYMDEAI